MRWKMSNTPLCNPFDLLHNQLWQVMLILFVVLKSLNSEKVFGTTSRLVANSSEDSENVLIKSVEGKIPFPNIFIWSCYDKKGFPMALWGNEIISYHSSIVDLSTMEEWNRSISFPHSRHTIWQFFCLPFLPCMITL